MKLNANATHGFNPFIQVYSANKALFLKEAIETAIVF